MEEAGFVCRSFDYQINEGTCILSSKTGSDVGGLYSGPLQQTSSEQQVHHFEMKPVLDCGGNLTSEHGNLASPGWPRNYVHHEHCMWNIRVQQFKIIHVKFMHFELGLQSSDACNPQDDRLEVSEPGVVPYCVMPNVRDIKSRGNEMTLTFVTNGERDGQGFRAFYASEWTCDAHFDESPGQFASPNWPENYPSGQRCMWRITAPSNQRVKVLFTSFKLEEHPLGHCSDDLDHVKVLDGGTITSPKIGLYCNSQYHLTLRSTGREMLVQFVSDEDKTREGFHASFVFESVNGTSTSDGDLGIIGIVDLDKEPTAADGSEMTERKKTTLMQ
jgi:cubilin